MSQEKVEKRRYEKKHRAELIKKQKRNKIIGWTVFGILVGCLLASTLGVKIYKSIPKYVEAEKLGAYVNELWAENGYGNYFTATDSDVHEDAEIEDTEDTEETENTEDTSSSAEDADQVSEDTAE